MSMILLRTAGVNLMEFKAELKLMESKDAVLPGSLWVTLGS